VVFQRLTVAIPDLDQATMELLAGDIHDVLSGVIDTGVPAMTFAYEDQGGGIAEGRLHVFNASGPPGQSAAIRPDRLLAFAIVMLAIGWGIIKVGALLARKQLRPAPRA
jgi:hypothetical protein